MHRAVSRLTDTVTVHAGDVHRQIRPGDVVDLDEPIGLSTLAECLGAHVAAFEPESEPAPEPKAKPARRQPASEETES